ncbi:MAG: hypothetical protein QOI73_3289 [Solirubrobacteraceae bacterium]|nr:hypothetical protein [Solirubrobacteraceae bacterium]
MALDRQTIEKRDFPIGRRGYEPASVDAHLAKLAREVEALQRDARSGSAAGGDAGTAAAATSSLASIASVQVQAIVEAAETTAASIEREARDNADQLEQQAAEDADRIREEALARSQDHVGKVQQATSLMLQRVEAMDSELSALVDSLRTGANRLSADLSLLSGNMGELYSTVRGGPEPLEPIVDYEDGPIEPEVEIVTVIEEDPVDAELDADEPAAVPGAATAADDDVEGARLIALNMALNGQSREETDRYLSENFDLSDRAGLLDEVYATVEG